MLDNNNNTIWYQDGQYFIVFAYQCNIKLLVPNSSDKLRSRGKDSSSMLVGLIDLLNLASKLCIRITRLSCLPS